MIRHLFANASACEKHFDREGDDGAERANDGEAKEAEEDRSHRLFAQCADEHCKDRTARRRAGDGAKDNGKIERDRPAMQDHQKRLENPLLLIVRIIKRFGNCLDLIANARQSRGEDIKEGGDAGQQEDRRQRHLDDVGDRVER
jgi:hypothetical protein